MSDLGIRLLALERLSDRLRRAVLADEQRAAALEQQFGKLWAVPAGGNSSGTYGINGLVSDYTGSNGIGGVAIQATRSISGGNIGSDTSLSAPPGSVGNWHIANPNLTTKIFTNLTFTLSGYNTVTLTYINEGIPDSQQQGVSVNRVYMSKTTDIGISGAGSATITITVYDPTQPGPPGSNSGAPVAGATVTVVGNGLNYTGTTDANGNVSFTLSMTTSPVLGTITMSKTGYVQSQIQNTTFANAANQPYTAFLSPSGSGS